MKDIEDAFQAVAESALRDRPAAFDRAQSETIFEFYALWQARAERRHLPIQNIPARPDVIGMNHDYTADELELLEKNGIGAFDGDGSIQTRHLMGLVIRLAMDRIRSAIADRQWSVIEASDGKFCVPDVPAHGIVPLSPSIALLSIQQDMASTIGVAEINQAMARGSREYIFACSVADCPGVESLTHLR